MMDYHFHCHTCGRVIRKPEGGMKHKVYSWEQTAGYCFQCDKLYLENDKGLPIAVEMKRSPDGTYEDFIYT